MCHEYISSSSLAILGMAKRFARSSEVPKDNDMKVVIKNQEEDNYPEMEEDPRCTAKAGIPFSTTPTNQDWQGAVETSIKQAMSTLPAVNGGNITLKVVVVPRSRILIRNTGQRT